MAHDPALLSRFLNGETRLIYARVGRAPEGELVELPQGEAVQWKERTKRELYCPIPDCPQPELTAVNRAPRRRDGFSHRPGGGGHAPESLFHIQGKARIAAWVTATYPSYRVVIEQASNTQRERIADVMVTAPDGHRWAIEIQYAALTAAKWKERSDSYKAQGITDIWLFGHTGAQMRARGPHELSGRFTADLSPAQWALHHSGRQVLWINPISGQLATTFGTAHADGGTFLVPTGLGRTLQPFDLSACELLKQGIDAPLLRQLRDGRKRAAEIEARRQAEAAERARLRDDELKRRLASKERTRLAKEERTRRSDAARRKTRELLALRLDEWRQSPAGERVVSLVGEPLPWWLTRRGRGHLPIPPFEWRGEVFLRITDHPAEEVSVRRVVAFLRSRYDLGSEPLSLHGEVRDWLYALEDAGWMKSLDRDRFEPEPPPERSWRPPRVAGEFDDRPIPASLCATCGEPLDRIRAHRGDSSHRGCLQSDRLKRRESTARTRRYRHR